MFSELSMLLSFIIGYSVAVLMLLILYKKPKD